MDVKTFTYAYVDIRGYGRSLDLRGNYTAKEIVSDTKNLLCTLEWDKFHVIGSAMTGLIAQRMAVDMPERIKSAVGVSPTSAECAKFPEEFKQFVIESITDADKARELLGMVFGDRLSPQWLDVKWQASRLTRMQEAARGYLEMFTAQPFDHELGRIDTPFLIVCGKYDLDDQQLAAQENRFRNWHDNIEFVEIECGHYAMQEAPVMLQTVMERFMRQHANS